MISKPENPRNLENICRERLDAVWLGFRHSVWHNFCLSFGGWML